jgi:type III secretion system FlhB-like substrate exporter
LIEVSAVTFPAYKDTEIFARDELLAERQEYHERAGKEPYGDVAYADPGYQKDKKKRYPINTKEHVKAAWSYINQKKNAAKYSSSQVASIKAKIKSAAKKFGVSIDSDEGKAEAFDLTDYCPRCGFEELPGETRDEQEPEPSTPAEDEDQKALRRTWVSLAYEVGDVEVASRLMAEVAEVPVN